MAKPFFLTAHYKPHAFSAVVLGARPRSALLAATSEVAVAGSVSVLHLLAKVRQLCFSHMATNTEHLALREFALAQLRRHTPDVLDFVFFGLSADVIHLQPIPCTAVFTRTIQLNPCRTSLLSFFASLRCFTRSLFFCEVLHG